MVIQYFALRRVTFLCKAFLTIACGVCLIVFASRAFGASPVGLWYAEGGAAEVQVFQCADELCGKVVWLRSPLGENGCELRDDKNPDPSLRSRNIVGLVVLTGLRSDDDGAAWTGGAIYDPASGHTYSCNARLEDDNRLFLRGYLGIRLLGRNTTWTRVGAIQCHK